MSSIFNVRRTTLTVELFGTQQLVYIDITDNLDILYSVVSDAIARITIKFATTGVVTIKKLVPLNSFEHFKLEYFPKFLISKFPVKYKELRFDCREIFPQYSHLIKDQGTRYLDVTTLG